MSSKKFENYIIETSKIVNSLKIHSNDILEISKLINKTREHLDYI